jgi:HEAT repeat protein
VERALTRRFLRFSLRSMLLVVTAGCLILGAHCVLVQWANAGAAEEWIGKAAVNEDGARVPTPKSHLIPVIAARLKRLEPAQRCRVGFVLFETSGRSPEVCRALVPVFLSTRYCPDAEVRRQSVNLLCSLTLESGAEVAQVTIPAFAELTSDPDMLVRYYACKSLGYLGPTAEEALPALIGRLDDDEIVVRTMAAWAIGRMRPNAKATVPHLVTLAQDEEPYAAVAGIKALGRIGSLAGEAVGVLRVALRDDNPWVRAEAAASLWKIDGDAEAVLPVLIQALEEDDTSARIAAVYGIRDIGRPAHAAVPVLLELTDDTVSNISQGAREALRRIRQVR